MLNRCTRCGVVRKWVCEAEEGFVASAKDNLLYAMERQLAILQNNPIKQAKIRRRIRRLERGVKPIKMVRFPEPQVGFVELLERSCATVELEPIKFEGTLMLPNVVELAAELRQQVTR